jgi:hypothetical protein
MQLIENLHWRYATKKFKMLKALDIILFVD